MLPFERLRYLARWTDGDGVDLVNEAADCLAAFEGDPAGLVVACRRLLFHHPASAPLWWLCARVLASADLGFEAWCAAEEFAHDGTPKRLATAFQFPSNAPIAVLGWPDLTSRALTERPDIEVLVVRDGDDAELSMRLRHAETNVRVITDIELQASDSTHLVVEAIASGGGRVLLPEVANELLPLVQSSGIKIWLVVGLGRAMPLRLFEAMLRACGDDDSESDHSFGTKYAVVETGFAERIYGPNGRDSPSGLFRRFDCPVAPELLRLAT